MGTGEAWDRFENDLKGLAGELKRHYNNASDASVQAEVRRSLDQLRQAADAVFRSVESTTKDPEVKSKTKDAARSFGLAVAETFRDLSEEIEKAARRR